MPNIVSNKCREILGTEIISAKNVAGGSINQAFQIQTVDNSFFLKLNSNSQAFEMFESEVKGLNLLRKAGTVAIPEVISLQKVDGFSFLILEFITPAYRQKGFWENFGQQLAHLHKDSNDRFGLDHNNFIGSLPQRNNQHSNWIEFFISERLNPQIELANLSNRLQVTDIQDFESLYAKLPSILSCEEPSLTHGDLWSGNFIVGQDNIPYIVDPAVSFAHREMDLAMTKLFGGFEFPFYQSYQEVFPSPPGLSDRIAIYQLYYLMVHVNLFAGGYINSVRTILRKFI